MVVQDWPFILSLLPQDLEETARRTGALRRKRAVQSADVLLRLLMAYAACGLSLRETADWARQSSLACLSDVALLKRFKNAAPFLGELLTRKMAQSAPLPQAAGTGVLRLVDATAVSSPGSSGTDWRVHLGFDLESFRTAFVEVTTVKGGESLSRFPWKEGEIAVADRGYGSRAGIACCQEAGAKIIVRLSITNCPLSHSDGRPFDLLAAGRTLAPTQAGDFPVETTPDPAQGLVAVPGRLVVLRKSRQAAEETKRKVAATARRKGRTPDPRSLEAAEYIFLFTTVEKERFSAEAVLELYRFRWQVEVLFRRLKGVLHLGELRAYDEALCRSVLLGKLLAALLMEELSHRWGALSPWGWGTLPSQVMVAPLPSGRGDAAPGGGGGAFGRPMGGTKRPALPLLPRSSAKAPQTVRCRHRSSPHPALPPPVS